MNHTWQVQILFGDAEVLADGPVMFGVPQVTVGEEGLSDPEVPLVYGPVAVRSHGHWICIETFRLTEDGEYEHVIHREMTMLDVEFTWHGAVRIEGYETRKDETLVHAAWEVEPYVESNGGDEPS